MEVYTPDSRSYTENPDPEENPGESDRWIAVSEALMQTNPDDGMASGYVHSTLAIITGWWNILQYCLYRFIASRKLISFALLPFVNGWYPNRQANLTF